MKEDIFKKYLEKIALFHANIEERFHAYRNFRHRLVSGYGF
jgi:hypothetical protein